MRRLLSTALAGLLLTSACDDRVGPVSPPRSTSPPSISIVFPAEGAHDRDGDGLVDLEVSFADSGGAVLPSSVTVTAAPSARGTGGGNLLDHWRVERLDAGGLVLEETRQALLPRGEVRLQVAVETPEEKGAVETVKLRLPPLSLHASVGLPWNGDFFIRMESDPEGRRLYVLSRGGVGAVLSVVDLDSMRMVQSVPIDWRLLVEPNATYLDLGRGRLYAGGSYSYVYLVFDLLGVALAEAIPRPAGPAYQTVAFTVDSVRQELYAVPFQGTKVTVIDLNTGRRLRDWSFDFLPAIEPVWFADAVLDPLNRMLYIGSRRWEGGGLIQVDVVTGRIVRQIDLDPGDDRRLGGVGGMMVHGRSIFAVTSKGVAVASMIEPGSVRVRETGDWVPILGTTTPDKRDFVVLAKQRFDTRYALLLIDPGSLSIESEIPLEIDSDRAYQRGLHVSGDGSLLFVGQEFRDAADPAFPKRIQVYLRR